MGAWVHGCVGVRVYSISSSAARSTLSTHYNNFDSPARAVADATNLPTYRVMFRVRAVASCRAYRVARPDAGRHTPHALSLSAPPSPWWGLAGR